MAPRKEGPRMYMYAYQCICTINRFWYIYIYVYLYHLQPFHDPCFHWTRPSFGEFNHQHKGQMCPRYISIFVLLHSCNFTPWKHYPLPHPTFFSSGRLVLCWCMSQIGCIILTRNHRPYSSCMHWLKNIARPGEKLNNYHNSPHHRMIRDY